MTVPTTCFRSVEREEKKKGFWMGTQMRSCRRRVERETDFIRCTDICSSGRLVLFFCVSRQKRDASGYTTRFQFYTTLNIFFSLTAQGLRRSGAYNTIGKDRSEILSIYTQNKGSSLTDKSKHARTHSCQRIETFRLTTTFSSSETEL